MVLDIGDFRTNFPEFGDNTVYPDSQITLWGTLAEQMVLESIWKNSWTMGVSLYVAHEITLATENAKTVTSGGSPGDAGGIASSKTVGNVSVTYDTTSTAEKDAGYWNLTTYGKQFIRLVRIFGAGCFQL